MTRRGGAALILSSALLLLLLAPSASADHAYSHRYVVFGRVVDSAGAPVDGAQVSLEATFAFEGACSTHPEAATDAWSATPTMPTNARGEFWICLHAHGLDADDPGTLRLTVDRHGSANHLVVQELPADPRLRVTFVDLVVPQPMDGNRSGLATEHTVAGRVWSPWVSGEKLDNVAVDGMARTDLPVEVRILDPAGANHAASTSTNAYGDFAVRVPLAAALSPDARVVITAEGRDFEARAGTTGWTFFEAELGPVAEFILVGETNGTPAWHNTSDKRPNPTLRVLPGANVTLIAVNAEATPHAMQVEGFPASDTLTARGDYRLYHATAPASGTVAYYCPFHPDTMRGLLAVVPEPALPEPTATPTPTEPGPTQPAPTPTATPTTEPAKTPVSLALALVGLALAAVAARRR